MPYAKLIYPAPGQDPYAMLLIADDDLLMNPVLQAEGWSAGADGVMESKATVRLTPNQRLQVIAGHQLVFDEVNSAGPDGTNWLSVTDARGLCMVIVMPSSMDTSTPEAVGKALVEAMDGKVASLWASAPVEV